MILFDVIYLGAIVFAVLCVRRLMAWRSAKAALGPRHLMRLATVTVLAAGYGLVLITVVAAVLVANHRQETGDFRGFQTLLMGLGAYVIGVPIANWLGMRLVGVRPAGLAAFGAWTLLGVALLLVQPLIPGGAVQPGWFYGLVALVPYAVAAAAVAAVPAPPAR
ncbi:hypothetical protein [Actinoplanes ianthinogenes]|uniref:hypothetical protein n=1 Tax=Actinoplanes ianthinogenes TaxID=122358 RepID=UPI0016707D0F|nr:hypothetical protein [Actinoplanes ianthinogenes]